MVFSIRRVLTSGFLLTLLGSLAMTAHGDDKVTASAVAAASNSRPQLTDTQAVDYTVAKYLAQAGTLTGPNGAGLVTDNWLPPAVGDVNSFVATYTVAADGSGTHATLQAAIDAVPAADTSSTRVYIHVLPGTYREVLCVKDKAPITLYSLSTDASKVLIVNGNYNGQAKVAGAETGNPCNPSTSAATLAPAAAPLSPSTVPNSTPKTSVLPTMPCRPWSVARVIPQVPRGLVAHKL